MKANKTPEKIYLYPYSTDGIYEVETKPLEGTIEYIRTDAFIEKACESLQNRTMKELCMKEEDTGLVQEFIESFKDYIKGE